MPPSLLLRSAHRTRKSRSFSMAPETEAPPETPYQSPVDAFGQVLARLGGEISRLVVLDGGPAGATGAHHFLKAHPDRYFGFGSAYQSMVAAASGLASVGLLPVVIAPAAFLLKATEQVRLALACSDVNAKIAGMQAGLDAGARGVVWQALEDIAVFRAIPGMRVLVPASRREAEFAMRAMLTTDGPTYLRLANGLCENRDGDNRFEIGKGAILRNGSDVTIAACGVQVERALEAATLLADDNIDARVVSLASIKPIDAELLSSCAEATGAIIATEDHS